MSTSLSLFTLYTLDWLYRAGVSPESALKRSAIMHDKFVVDTKMSRVDMLKLLSLQASEDDKKVERLRADKRFVDMFVTSDELDENIDEFRTNLYEEFQKQTERESFERVGLLQFAVAHVQQGDAIDPPLRVSEHGYSSARFWVQCVDTYRRLAYDFYVFDHLSEIAPSICGLGSPFHRAAIEEKGSHSTLNQTQSLLESQLCLPSFEDMSWDEIFELRDDGCIVPFRNKMVGLLETVHAGNPDSELNSILEHELWNLVSEVRPKIGKSMITSILGNMPLGPIPINPIGIGSAIRENLEQKKLQQNYGWIFFIQHARGMEANRKKP